MKFNNIDELCVKTLRMISLDMIQNAKSGHIGIALGIAPTLYILWNNFLKINPKTSKKWINRDRFILSSGHCSALLYCILYFFNYKLTINDLKNFRNFKSNTPGHPEINITDGVEATTGPLGQGFAMGVGIAMAEAHFSSIYNKKNFKIINHYTYVLCGDGDLMEGISYEASSIAGHLKLNKLIVLYDSNKITLDGKTSLTFTENIKLRFISQNWNYILVKNGNNLLEIFNAINKAKNFNNNFPTIIEIRTIIGFKTPFENTSLIHGNILNNINYNITKKNYNWKYKNFEIPKIVYKHFEKKIKNKILEEKKWNILFSKYKKNFPLLAKQFNNLITNDISIFNKIKYDFYKKKYINSGRNINNEIIQKISQNILNFWGGSADLSSSTKTIINNSKIFKFNKYKEKNIFFGIREHAMGAIINGIKLHSNNQIYCSTFLVFSDYLKPAIRLSALQKLPVIYIFTHDSIAVGEDGATHEPIEQLTNIRNIPNIQVFRPADGNEIITAWDFALKSKTKPTVLILSRQNLPTIKNGNENLILNIKKGAYIISKAKSFLNQDGILISTGSEVNITIKAQEILFLKYKKNVSVISIPCYEIFEQQSEKYIKTIFPQKIKKFLIIEASVKNGWNKLHFLFKRNNIKFNTITINNKFGESANEKILMKKFGFSVENIIKKYLNL